MQRYVIENQGIQSFLVCTLLDDEILDEVSYESVHNNQIPGILPTFLAEEGGKRMLKINITSRISLEHYFNRLMSRAVFLRAFASMIDTLHIAEQLLLDESYLLLDSQHIYVDVGTQRVEFICIPVLHTDEPVERIMFLRDIVYQTQFDPSENANYVAQIIHYLDDKESFSLVGLKEKLNELLIEEEPAIMVFEKGRAKVSMIDFTRRDQPEPVQMDWIGPRISQSEEEEKKIEFTSSIPIPAYLIRSKTAEKIRIVKQVYKIGKEKNFVDYCVIDNPTISRSHANIIMENGEYYIVDVNSKNHTYVNGREIPSGARIKLITGSKITLSDEEFMFYIAR